MKHNTWEVSRMPWVDAATGWDESRKEVLPGDYGGEFDNATQAAEDWATRSGHIVGDGGVTICGGFLYSVDDVEGGA